VENLGGGVKFRGGDFFRGDPQVFYLEFFVLKKKNFVHQISYNFA
jgi:hypothetical protein